LIWKLSQSKGVSQLFASPGNAGTAQLAKNLDIGVSDFAALAKAARENLVELIVVGPEVPLAEGIVDYFDKVGLPIFGPRRAAAELESSKSFSKALFQKYGIPCAKSETFTDPAAAKRHIKKVGAPLVIKADGLAAGKGVIIAETEAEAFKAVSNLMEDKTFGAAGSKVILEEKLSGKEMSYFAISDGQNILPLMAACDYKRAEDGDQGFNTGGMGSYAPPYFFTPELEKKVLSEIIEPTIKAMAAENRPFKGVLFAGLMIKDGAAKILEYNVRFGDPECQVILPLLKTDLLDIILAATSGDLRTVKTEWRSERCVGVVMASGGYPGGYKTGLPISGLDQVDPGTLVFHAGTKFGAASGEVLTNGGRVLTVVALGKTYQEAREKSYANLSRIHFENCHYRNDIANF
jgi:phosphoribosylamine---glycine ligase